MTAIYTSRRERRERRDRIVSHIALLAGTSMLLAFLSGIAYVTVHGGLF